MNAPRSDPRETLDGQQGIASSESTIAVVEDLAIRSFRIDVPEQEIAELRRRLRATRWPDKETVSALSQRVQPDKLREMDKGGHFAAWEQPQIFEEEVGAAFRSVRS